MKLMIKNEDGTQTELADALKEIQQLVDEVVADISALQAKYEGTARVGD